MVRLIVTPVWTFFFTDNYIYEILRELLRVRPDGFWFSKKYKSGRWDGYYNFCLKNKFPTGLLSKVIQHLSLLSIQYELIDSSQEILPAESYLLPDFEPREYQVDMIQQVLNQKRCVIQLPTNAGKTEVCFSVLKAYNQPFLYFVHLKDLFYQTQKRMIDRMKIDSGMIGDGKHEIKEIGNIIMIQSFNDELAEQLRGYPIMVIDECHHSTGGGEWYKRMMKVESPIRIGLSATPLSNNVVNDWKLLCLTGPVIGDVTNKFMIDQGYSTKPVIHVHPVNIPKYIHVLSKREQFKEYAMALDYILTNSDRTKLIVDIVNSYKDKQIMILVNRVKIGQYFKSIIPNSEFVFGGMATIDRLETRKRFEEENLKVIVTTLLGEGIDIPNIDVLVLTYPIASERHLLQRLGRGMRKSPDKQIIHVIDFKDTCCKYFENALKQRELVYRQERFDVIYENAIEATLF